MKYVYENIYDPQPKDAIKAYALNLCKAEFVCTVW